MFGREKRFGRDAGADRQYEDGGNVATAERPTATNGAATDRTGADGATTVREPVRPTRGNGAVAAAGAGAGAVAVDREARLRQRDRFGGFNWGAAFFGWLVA